MANEALQKVWRARLKSFGQSKQTIRAWCAQHDVPVHQFNYWRRQLAVSPQQSKPFDDAKPSNDNWLAVAVAPEPTIVPAAIPTTSGGVAIRMGEAVIEVSRGFDGALLRAVVHALESAPC
jgi:hypothetical protein